MQDFERNGLQLPEDQQKQVQAWQQKLSKLGIQYHQNLTEESIELTFSADELKGLSDDFIARLEKGDDGKFKVRCCREVLDVSYFCSHFAFVSVCRQVVLSYPTVFPILNTCTVERTRKAVEVAFNRRCIDSNVQLLEEMLDLRNKLALALGYENHAAYVLEQRYVAAFLPLVDTNLLC